MSFTPKNTTAQGNGASLIDYSVSTRGFGASPMDWDDAVRLGLLEHLLPFIARPNVVPLAPGDVEGSNGSEVEDFAKVPSRYHPKRRDRGMGFPGWNGHIATSALIKVWSRQPDYGICIQTRRLRALDIDIIDPAKAGAIVAAVYQHLKIALPKRYRANTGKCLLVFWLPADEQGDFFYRSIGTDSGVVEFLATNEQFAAVGTIKNGSRYQWGDLDCLPELAEVPTLDREQFESLWASLMAQFAMPDSENKSNGETRSAVAKNAIDNDPVAQKFIDAGMVRSNRRPDGGLNVHCPQEDLHSGDSGKTEATYWPPHTGGFPHGGFMCQHGHCKDSFKIRDVRKFFGLSDGNEISKEDFWCYLPAGNQYIFVPTGAMWPAASVDTRVPPIQLTPASDTTAEGPQAKPAKGKAGKHAQKKKRKRNSVRASLWISWHRRVDQMVWTPGEPQVILDRLASDGGWIPRTGTTCYNLYRPPILAHGNVEEAGPWLDLVHRVFGDDAEHIIRWLAQRVQRPGEKINHALVLGGSQGIGKDTILEPVKQAVGPWNFGEVSPVTLLGQFNPYLKSVILRVSEARDLGESNRYAFYDHMKTYTAAPPDVLSCNEKHLKPYTVFNVVGVIITSNHKIDGIHLPADDRRHFVAWSELTKEDFEPDYWIGLWKWYANGGIGHVAAYLQTLDLSAFDPKAPPVKTAAFWAIVDANRAPEDAELADTIDGLNNPSVLTLRDLQTGAEHGLRAWLEDRKNRRIIPHRLEAVGYESVRNDTAKDGLWSVAGRRQAVYGQKDLSMRDKIAAIQAIIKCAGSKAVATVVADFDSDDPA
jgi:Family of unknown function (DUF5906)